MNEAHASTAAHQRTTREDMEADDSELDDCYPFALAVAIGTSYDVAHAAAAAWGRAFRSTVSLLIATQHIRRCGGRYVPAAFELTLADAMPLLACGRFVALVAAPGECVGHWVAVINGVVHDVYRPRDTVRISVCYEVTGLDLALTPATAPPPWFPGWPGTDPHTNWEL